MFGRSKSKAPSLGDTIAGAADQVRGWAEHVWQDSADRAAPVAAGGAKAIKAAELPAFVTDAITRVTGDKKSGRKLQKAAERWAKEAEKQLKKQAKKKKKSRRGLLILGITVAAGGAAYAVWRLSQPVEDPWTNPTPQPLSS